MNIVVNGKRYTNFISAKVSAGMGQLAREFTFVAASRGVADIPFRAGDACQIFEGEDRLLTGYIEKIVLASSGKGHTYTLSGRDLMGDVIDSNLPRRNDIDVPLPDVCRLVLDFLGIDAKVIDLAGTQSRPFGFVLSAEPEDTGGEFLSQLARRKRVLLQSDGDGNMVITEGIGLRTKNQLINRIDGEGNNMLSASLTLDHSHRFGRYTTELQVNMAVAAKKGKNDSPEQIATSVPVFITDEQIRPTRFRTTAADYNLGIDEGLERPLWEIGLNRAESIKYDVVVPGFRNWEDTLWELNTAPAVFDEYNGIDTKMLISKIEYILDGTGKTTRMVLTDRDAFKAELKIRKDIELDGRAAT